MIGWRSFRSRIIMLLLGRDSFIANVTLQGTDIQILPAPDSQHCTVGGLVDFRSPSAPEDFDIQALLSTFRNEPPTVH